MVWIAVHFHCIEKTCRRDLACRGVCRNGVFFFDGVSRSHERFRELRFDRADDLRTGFFRVVRAVAVNMLAVVIDRNVWVTYHGDDFFSVRVRFELCRFGTGKVRCLCEVYAFETLRVVVCDMGDERPAVIKVLVRCVQPFDLEDDSSRNVESVVDGDGEVVLPSVVCCHWAE